MAEAVTNNGRGGHGVVAPPQDHAAWQAAPLGPAHTDPIPVPGAAGSCASAAVFANMSSACHAVGREAEVEEVVQGILAGPGARVVVHGQCFVPHAAWRARPLGGLCCWPGGLPGSV